MDSVNVAVKSAWASKTNWLQVVSAGATLATALVAGLPPADAAKWTALIAVATNVATIIIKTFFTPTVTPSSAKKA